MKIKQQKESVIQGFGIAIRPWGAGIGSDVIMRCFHSSWRFNITT